MNIKRNKIILTGIFFLGLLLRLKGLFSPFLDLYPMRQEQCAMLARNFYRNGFNFFNPQLDWFGTFNSSWRLDFPIIQYLTSLLYGVFGIHEYLARLVAIIFSLGSIYYLYKLVKTYFDIKSAIFASLFFAISPLNVYFSRTFMPDSLMIFFTLTTIYYFSKWLDNEKPINYFISILSAALAFLIKITTLYLIPPLIYLSYLKYKKKIFKKWQVLLFFILSLFPMILWYRMTNFKMSENLFSIFAIRTLLNNDFYRRIFESVSIFVLTPLGIILFILGMFLKTDKKSQLVFHIWLFSLAFYILLTPYFNYIHYYYQLPLVPVVSVFIGRSFLLLTDKNLLNRFTIIPRYVTTKVLVTVVLLVILFMSFLSIRPFYKWNKVSFNVAKKIEKLTPRDAIIIIGRCSQEAFLYYCDRKGWIINEFGELSYSWAYKGEELARTPKEEIALVEYLIDQGASFYVTTNMKAFRSNPNLADYMYGNYKVFDEGEEYIIFKLT